MIQNRRLLSPDFSSDDNFELSAILEVWRLSEGVSDFAESAFTESLTGEGGVKLSPFDDECRDFVF